MNKNYRIIMNKKLQENYEQKTTGELWTKTTGELWTKTTGQLWTKTTGELWTKYYRRIMNKNYRRIMNKKLQENYEQKTWVGFWRYQLYIPRHCALIFRKVQKRTLTSFGRSDVSALYKFRNFTRSCIFFPPIFSAINGRKESGLICTSHPILFGR